MPPYFLLSQRIVGSPLAIAMAIPSYTTACERSVFRGVFPAASLKLVSPVEPDVNHYLSEFSAGYSPRPH